MRKVKERAMRLINKKEGMEMVQVAILVAIAVVIGLLFRTHIEKFVNEIFSTLSSGKFS
jgi:hypothetical protein